MRRLSFFLPVVFFAALAGCGAGGDATVPGDSSDMRPYSGIGDDDLLRFTGTEPFWGGDVRGEVLTWKTPENPTGIAIMITRFGGRGGLSLGGDMDGRSFDMTFTPGDCSDGMSDRIYPYLVSVKIGQDDYSGCGWSDRKGWSGPEAP